MIVARIVRSNATMSIELPPGFELAEGEMEVQYDGHSLVLRPIVSPKTEPDDWAWLDDMQPVSQEFIDAIARIEAEDTAMARCVSSHPPVI